MIDVRQFRFTVVRPVLHHLDLWSQSAENFLLGTAVQESGLTHLRQLGQGPALGLYQIEPVTERDVHLNFLKYRPHLSMLVNELLAPMPDHAQQLITNLAYATAIARIIYLRCPDPLPDSGDPVGMARYWKKVFNTEKGRGSVPAFVLNYKEFVSCSTG